MKTFNAKTKQRYIERAKMHRDNDEIVQGIYWEGGKGSCLCEAGGNTMNRLHTFALGAFLASLIALYAISGMEQHFATNMLVAASMAEKQCDGEKENLLMHELALVLIGDEYAPELKVPPRKPE